MLWAGTGCERSWQEAHAAGKLRGISWHCRNWAVPGKRRCRFHGGLSTGPKTPEGKAAVVAAMQEGRRRRIAELALAGKKINTGRRRANSDLSPEAQRLEGLVRQLDDERRTRDATEFAEKQVLPRKRGRPTKTEVLARFGAKSDEELIAKARAALPVLRQRWLSST